MTTLTVIVQRGSADPDGQLLPGAVVEPVRVMTCPPDGHGLATMIPPVSVTVAPTGTSPVHTAPVVPIDSAPELAVSLPTSLICAAVFGVVKLTLIPWYGVCPVLAIVVVSFTVAPRVRRRGDRQLRHRHRRRAPRVRAPRRAVAARRRRGDGVGEDVAAGIGV